MNKQLLEFIKHLTAADLKDLKGKALKAFEEGGELSKSILAYENAPGSQHKFIPKEKVLEQACDLMLVALSIPYSMGFTDEDIEEMLKKKTAYWQQLQAKEKKVSYPLIYEMHVTIKAPENIDFFKECCSSIEVKPIVLDLENNNEIITKDVMTSSVFYGDNKGAYDQLKNISNFMKEYGFEVIREKIETVPWHPAAPSESDINPTMPKDCYFEAHIGVRTTITRKKDLFEISERHKAHLSRNFFKKVENGEFINMVTLRKHDGTIEKFTLLVDNLKKDLEDNYFTFKKPDVEFSIYDSKVSHDYSWIK